MRRLANTTGLASVVAAVILVAIVRPAVEAGARLLYAWTASASSRTPGERDGGTSQAGPAEVAIDRETRQQATGTLTAPFTGIHGRY